MLTIVTAATSVALTTDTAALRELKLGQSDLDDIDEVISAASAICARFCKRERDEFGAQTVRQTERLECSQDCIILARDINVAITSVVEDGTTLDTDAYELDDALLYRLDDDGRIPWPAVKIVITYTTGWTLPANVPEDLERACLDVMAGIISARGRDPTLRSERVEGVVSESYRDPRPGAEGVPDVAASRLEPYIRWRR